MTEEELKAREATLGDLSTEMPLGFNDSETAIYIGNELLAEVRRLRGALHDAADVMPAKKFIEICSKAGLDDAETKAIFLGQTNG